MKRRRLKMDAEKKKRLAEGVAQRRAASFARLKKSGHFKTIVERHEHQEPARKLARA
jgi:hypothetical protein